MSSMDLLVRTGFTIDADDDRVVLTPPGGTSQAFHLVVRKQPPRPAKVTSPPASNSLLYAPVISPGSATALTSAGWSWISDRACELRTDAWNHTMSDEPRNVSSSTRSPRRVRRGRPASATWAVARLLATTSEPLRQAELAAKAAATQGRVSQILTSLSKSHLAARDSRGWATPDRDMLAKWFLEQYPGPGGIESWWFHLDPLLSQTDLVIDAHPDVVVSGDGAADDVAPWRSPTHAVLYSPTLLDLRSLGFVPADGAADGTVLLVALPADASVLSSDRIADPLQIAYDLHRLGGDDRREAADRVLRVGLRK